MPSCDISKQKRGGELLNASLGTSTRRPRPAASRVLKVEGHGGTPACRGQSRSPARLAGCLLSHRRRPLLSTSSGTTAISCEEFVDLYDARR
jgi:hypothetical protein